MEIISYISQIAIPITITLIIIYGIMEKNKVFDTFIKGAKEGIEIVINLFPTLLGIFLAVGALRNSGLIEQIISVITPIIEKIQIPAQIVPLMLIRPISGSASMVVATDIMQKNGVDSLIGIIAAVIIGSTETTFYTIAIYTSVVKIKKTRGILIAALAADIVGMLTAVGICRFMSEFFS